MGKKLRIILWTTLFVLVTSLCPGITFNTSIVNADTNLLSDNFSSGDSQWSGKTGMCAVESGEYSLTDVSGAATAFAGNASWTDYTYEADVNAVGGDYDVGLTFRVTDANNLYCLAIRSNSHPYTQNRGLQLYKVVNGTWTTITNVVNPSISDNTMYHYKVVLKGNNIKVYFNNGSSPSIDINDSTYSSGKIGLRTWKSHAHFDNISASIAANGEGSILHLINPDHVIGDVHPYYNDGTWYLYYLDSAGYNSHLATSTDMLDWQFKNITHTSPGQGQYLQNWYVLGVLKINGEYKSYYGCLNDLYMRSSVSTDLINWDFTNEAESVPAQVYSDIRDPYVFWNDTDNKYWCIMDANVGSPTSTNGAVIYSTSTDLTNWQGKGTLFYPGNIGDPECPQMFHIGSKWYLLASIQNCSGDNPVGRPKYWVSNNPTGPWTSYTTDCLDGRDLEAAQVAYNGSKWILMGWIPTSQGVWGGHASLPHEVYQLADGELVTRLETSVSSKIRGASLFSDASTITSEAGTWNLSNQVSFTGTGYGKAAIPGSYNRMDMTANLSIGSGSQRAGVLFGDSIEVAVDRTNSKLKLWSPGGTTYSDLPIQISDWSNVQLRVIVEGDIIETFLNDRYSLCARISSSLANTSVKLCAQEGTTTFSGINIYQLNDLEHLNQ